MAIKSRNKVSTAFNMSSMTDIVFLLLIFFLIASTMISPNGMKVLLPKSSQRTTGKQNISVTVTEDHKYYINTDLVKKEQLEPRLKARLSAEEKPGIILRADEAVDVKSVVYVMDIAQRNKYEVVLATRGK
ncbi:MULTISPECIES: ExbD/TolR family protein [Salibacter]|jgi:biopolymer transport protein ExbD|uniref:Biopolymer transporter ExbD n=1 Tax=Salibacter halophilus TaxID=1803916 RepID=A0A6N6M882_9FLAO|nr:MULTISPECIES: biopolymer transporter ExbD [Salibacter]KAB1066300.1 biopolymer transporter ExbD [Salibacter halophilus]MDR9398259.1 biopolymer transporter ExbD [Salibacter sp.]MDR9488662.1 biopolymer transporter ExbD [Salibacter sp.]